MAADHIPIAPVLILSTGRCGSTMVSEMLNRHPQVLSLSEFFMPLGPECFARREPTGEDVWRVLSTQSPALHAMLKDGHMVDEGLYPLGAPGARFKAQDLPPIMATALPHLTPQYEALFDELEAFVRPRPKAPIADHYRALFGYLQQKFGRRIWVERSGGSLMIAAKLLRLFPEARVVHVYRDGRDTAMSMSKHHNFRVLVAAMRKARSAGIHPSSEFLKPEGSRADVWIRRLFFRFFDTQNLGPESEDLAEYGNFWSELIVTAHQVLKSLPNERLLNLRFEDVQNSPREKLSELITFLDPSLEDAAWLEEASSQLHPTRSRFSELPVAEREALTHACAPGLELLGYSD